MSAVSHDLIIVACHRLRFRILTGYCEAPNQRHVLIFRVWRCFDLQILQDLGDVFSKIFRDFHGSLIFRAWLSTGLTSSEAEAAAAARPLWRGTSSTCNGLQNTCHISQKINKIVYWHIHCIHHYMSLGSLNTKFWDVLFSSVIELDQHWCSCCRMLEGGSKLEYRDVYVIFQHIPTMISVSINRFSQWTCRKHNFNKLTDHKLVSHLFSRRLSQDQRRFLPGVGMNSARLHGSSFSDVKYRQTYLHG